MKFYDCMMRTMDKFGVEEGYQPTDALFFVLEGSFTLTVDGKTVIVKQNDLVAFPKNVKFRRKITSKLKFYYVKLDFDKNMPCGILPIKNKMRVLSSLKFILEAAKREDAQKTAEYFLNDIFVQIDTEKLFVTSKVDPLVERVIQFLYDNLTEKISLSDIAENIEISKSGLIERFKLSTGKTPMNYLSELRLNAAEELLVTTDDSLSLIAEKCGFENAFYLSNTFKKSKGISPKFYRQKHRI